MTTTVNVVIDTFTDLEVPVGTVAGNYLFTILDSTGKVLLTSDVATPSTSFPLETPGSYTATAQLFDSNKNALGTQITATFVIPVPTTTVKVPATITVSLA